jgi:hypothetical protein
MNKQPSVSHRTGNSAFSSLLSAMLLALTLLPAVSAQSGSYGFLINAWLSPQAEDSGTAFLGVMNFDGAGNVTGSLTFQRGAGAKAAQTRTGPLTATYSSNPDGTGSVTLPFGGVLTFTFAMVIGDGGQSFQLVGTHLDGGDISGTVYDGFARAAYAGPLKGSYTFQLNNSPVPAGTIGVVSFDGAGNVSVKSTSVGAGTDPNQPPVSSGTLTGTYSINPDGSGTINLPVQAGQSTPSAFAIVITDGGSGLLILQTDGTGHDVSFGTGRLQQEDL